MQIVSDEKLEDYRRILNQTILVPVVYIRSEQMPEPFSACDKTDTYFHILH
jgi:hypothetical protein